ncbi:MAG: hypothetical protein O2931_04390 [Planctomycetota bacterium]|nr:hypothetical protein [Planctomycetota bacterium]MDA1178020.1 hypothetical protein [Planctomycetota bacterium]
MQQVIQENFPWRLFHGDVSDAQAYVYLEYSSSADLDHAPFAPNNSAPIDAVLDGPHSDLAATLPARTAFRDAGPGQTLLSAAILNDPCFWTPELPLWYRVQAKHQPTAQSLDTILGIRRLGCRGPNFMWNNRRYVFRMIDLRAGDRPNDEQFLAWRQSCTSLRLLPDQPILLDQASRYGVPVVLDLRELNPSVWHQVYPTLRYPAVAMAILDPRQADQLPQLRHLAPNLLLGMTIQSGAVESSQPYDLPDIWFWPANATTHLANLLSQTDRPIIAYRTCSPTLSYDDSRIECDRLQRDLAPHTQLGGYAVWHLTASQ